MANKKKNKYGNPQKNIEAQKAAEAAKLAKEAERAAVQQAGYGRTSDKSMLMRIIVIAVAAVMVLGIVVSVVANF